PFAVKVLSAENLSVEVPGETNDRGFLPPWLATLLLSAPFIVCFLFLIPFISTQGAARAATQTAFFEQTQDAIALQVTETPSGLLDSDGDGLINSEEIKIGTDPFKTNTDEDGLSDGDEVTV